MKRSALVLVFVLGSLAAAWASGLLSELTQPEAIRHHVAAAGIWGPFLFIAIAVALFGVFMLAPAIWAAGALWPLAEAFSYSFVAALLGSVGTYALTRQLGRNWARERIPPTIRRWEAGLESRPFLTVITLRLILWANPLVDMMVAVTEIPVRVYILSTVLGLVPPTAFHVLVGVGGVEMVAWLPWWGWVLLIVVPPGGIVLYRQMRSSRASAEIAE